MKRLRIPLVLLIITVSLLSSCISDTPPIESQQTSNAVQSEPSETNSLDISNGPAFKLTRAEFVEAFKDGFNNLPDGLDAPNAFDHEPSVIESLGCAVYTFEVDACTEFVIYAHPETDEVIRVMIRSLSNKIEEENATTFGIYSAFLTGFFASSDEVDKMDEALAIATTPYTQDTINFYHGRNAEFSYTITDGLLWVRISPPDT